MNNMASSSEVDVCAMAKHMAQVCLSANEAEARKMARLCEVGKAYLKYRARDLVLGAGNLPVLVHYS